MLGVCHLYVQAFPRLFSILFSAPGTMICVDFNKSSLAHGHWQETGGRRQKDSVLIFLAPDLLVTTGWLCPSVQSHSPGQTALPVTPSLSPESTPSPSAPSGLLASKELSLLLAPEGDPIPFLNYFLSALGFAAAQGAFCSCNMGATLGCGAWLLTAVTSLLTDKSSRHARLQ